MKRLLSFTLLVDGIITFGFGLVSWILPVQTFGSILAFPDSENSAFFALLTSMSVFYLLIGLVCFVGYRAKSATNVQLGLVMLGRHFIIGLLGFLDLGSPWLIGDPYPDLVIHAIFSASYLFGIIHQRAHVIKQASF